MIGWLSTLLYQLGASAVVVNWSQHVVHLIELASKSNIPKSVVQAPLGWSEELTTFYRTGQIINLPAVAITIAVTVLLVIGIRETAIINLVFVIIKVIILLIFIFACCIYVDRNNYTPFFPLNQGIMT
jgi:APA family basic amino acid/polyamine antiporter